MRPSQILITILLAIILFGCKQEENQADSSKTEFVKSSDGVNIAYQVHGDGSNALVLVHGWCCDKSYWEEQILFLKNNYKVVAIDLAGHGESGLDRESYTVYSFANDVTAVTNQLQLNNFILIGHSLGGYVVLEAALQNPEKTTAIFPIDSYGWIPGPKTEEELQAMEKEHRRQFAENFKSSVSTMVKGMFVPESDSVLVDWVVDDMSSAVPKVGIDAFANLFQYVYRDFGNSLKSSNSIPIICIGAGEEPQIEAFKNIHPVFENLQMDGVGHFLMMEDPDTFNQLFDDQLKQILR
ncbi:alpha/beta fold hydrolase [Bacteroidota bacterium]